ncbi:hypothetical protein [Streptomyces yaizuensis]|uniref:DUF2530 domain-containing protein n=1 Tax=Streptomyces yaizuensis TaxID=2989713 RepID=A0ABQ5NXE4_9ACTN|nr:hypothetical protein [Streptomyces sp. YSPA8]GLF95029.1 hypothetical protein SYYSPA8_12050 [Streptomyces sp. YSPA8]
MRTRQIAGPLVFGWVIVLSGVGYSLNDGTPSIPWAVAGLAVGCLCVFGLQRSRGW